MASQRPRGTSLRPRPVSGEPSTWLTVLMDADRVDDLRFTVDGPPPDASMLASGRGDASRPALDGTSLAKCRSAAARSLPPADRHDVLLYRSEAESVASAADFLTRAAAEREKIVLVVPPEHREAVEDELRRRRVRLDPASYYAMDAAETVDRLLVRGRPDHSRFHTVIGDVVEELASQGRVSIYGEMVNVLWEQGDVAAARRVEEFWNELGARLDFTRLCGYKAGETDDAAALDDLCRLHAHLRQPQS